MRNANSRRRFGDGRIMDRGVYDIAAAPCNSINCQRRRAGV
jgi:hypothetical protein